MRSIGSFIRDEVLLPRLKHAGVLVVYDPEQRYRELCLALAGDKRRVIDAGGSSIESREAALSALQEIGEPEASVAELLVCDRPGHRAQTRSGNATPARCMRSAVPCSQPATATSI